jgi:hypothetical protein
VSTRLTIAGPRTRTDPHVPRAARGQCRQLDVGTEQSAEHLLHLRDALIQVHHLRLEQLLPAERQQLLREPRGPQGCRPDFFDVRAKGLVGLEICRDHFRVTQDDGKEIVEVVRHAARETPDRLHLLRMTELLLQMLSLSEIQRDLDVLLVGVQLRDGGEHRNSTAVLADALLLEGARDTFRPELLTHGGADLPRLRRHHPIPAQMACVEVLARVTEHREICAVGLEDSAGAIGNRDPHDVRLREPSQASRARSQGSLGFT